MEKIIVTLLIAFASYTYASDQSLEEEYHALARKISSHNRLVEMKNILGLARTKDTECSFEKLAKDAEMYKQEVKSFLQRASQENPKEYNKEKIEQLKRKLTVKNEFCTVENLSLLFAS